MATAPPGAAAAVLERAAMNGGRRPSISDGEIARRAYERYLARGREDGRDLDDWLEAEREVRAEGESA